VDVFRIEVEGLLRPHPRGIDKLEDCPVPQGHPRLVGQRVEKVEHLVDRVELGQALFYSRVPDQSRRILRDVPLFLRNLKNTLMDDTFLEREDFFRLP